MNQAASSAFAGGAAFFLGGWMTPNLPHGENSTSSTGQAGKPGERSVAMMRLHCRANPMMAKSTDLRIIDSGAAGLSRHLLPDTGLKSGSGTFVERGQAPHRRRTLHLKAVSAARKCCDLSGFGDLGNHMESWFFHPFSTATSIELYTAVPRSGIRRSVKVIRTKVIVRTNPKLNSKQKNPPSL